MCADKECLNQVSTVETKRMSLVLKHILNIVFLSLLSVSLICCEDEVLIRGFDLNFDVAPCLIEGEQALACSEAVSEQIGSEGGTRSNKCRS